eukprot:TRINITY_DN36463_c0_g1_i1.p1 TRINITY_DN36463_c0_g1~~TRINITY_DN36463_c0_g1_i1.p1  ORF type:complete len:381 (+),score=116.44 TRINITY_DN36463_c0_g1_i1:94-1143(+)
MAHLLPPPPLPPGAARPPSGSAGSTPVRAAPRPVPAPPADAVPPVWDSAPAAPRPHKQPQSGTVRWAAPAPAPPAPAGQCRSVSPAQYLAGPPSCPVAPDGQLAFSEAVLRKLEGHEGEASARMLEAHRENEKLRVLLKLVYLRAGGSRTAARDDAVASAVEDALSTTPPALDCEVALLEARMRIRRLESEVADLAEQLGQSRQREHAARLEAAALRARAPAAERRSSREKERLSPHGKKKEPSSRGGGGEPPLTSPSRLPAPGGSTLLRVSRRSGEALGLLWSEADPAPVLRGVQPEGPAARAGARGCVGMLLTHVAGRPVHSVEDVARAQRYCGNVVELRFTAAPPP